MASTQYYLAASLDGYIALPDGNIDWLTGFSGASNLDAAEANEGPMVAGGAYERFYAEIGAVAMGSKTYEFILEAAGSWPYADVPSWVFSTRELPIPEGADVRLVRGDVAPPHAEMVAAAAERNVWIVGGGDLASQFTAKGLLDELLLTSVPVVLGKGIPVFAEPLDGELRLTGSQAFRNGMIELRYELPRGGRGSSQSTVSPSE